MGLGFGSQRPGNQYSPYPSPMAHQHNMQNRPRPLIGVPIETLATNSWGQNMQNQPKSFVEELINVQACTLSNRNMPKWPPPLMAESIRTSTFTHPQRPFTEQVNRNMPKSKMASALNGGINQDLGVHPQTLIPEQFQSWRTSVGLEPMPNFFCQNCNKYISTLKPTLPSQDTLVSLIAIDVEFTLEKTPTRKKWKGF